MRRRSTLWLAITLGLLPMASHAANFFEIIWTATTGVGTPGGSNIDADPGDQLVAEIRLTPDAGGVAGYAISLEFDTDLDDELDLVNATQLLPGVMEGSLTGGVGPTQESTAGQEGHVFTYNAVALTIAGPTSGTYVIGTVSFDVTGNVTTDGDDVFAGPFNAAADGVINNANAGVAPVFASAAVNSASSPVPALSRSAVVAVSLLVSLGGIWALARRRRLDGQRSHANASE